MKKNIFILKFSEFGGGKYSYYFHKKEWFDWIFTKETKPLASMVDSLFNDKAEMKFQNLKTRDDAENFFKINSKSGSFENDKALLVRFISEETPEKTKELIKWLEKNDFKIKDEYDGMIY